MGNEIAATNEDVGRAETTQRNRRVAMTMAAPTGRDGLAGAVVGDDVPAPPGLAGDVRRPLDQGDVGHQTATEGMTVVTKVVVLHTIRPLLAPTLDLGDVDEGSRETA